jgi:hypothetical protein
VSVDTGTGFLTPANPSFDLGRLIKTSNDDLLFGMDFRDVLIEQPKLGNRERLPRTMALEADEFALSKDEFDGSFYLPSVNMWVNGKHRLVLDLLLEELANIEIGTTHGTHDTYKSGCTGPMCRRAIRVERSIAEALRRTRNGATGTNKPKHLIRPNEWHKRVRRAAPQYASVDPLTVAVTVLAHRMTPAQRPTAESKTFMSLDNNDRLYEYLHIEYSGLVK